ncbi:hypothetical protein QBC41DRAFT_301509 [Cercophora samala]|uniref:Ubiquitin 3 binding protein But2 C-terminal domain-containing protein n=1 Tax=Cercophora samala TaxID=330535 RepID=A0AA39ZG68_9PEZI|nr:hypothetical protein QBC41DRAFT_301509 [Cercophora samala]
MQFTTILTILSVAIGLTIAAPTNEPCKTTTQAQINRLHLKNRPKTSYYTRTIATIFVPTKIGGSCSLIATFPSNYTILDSNLNGKGPSSVAVYPVSNGPAGLYRRPPIRTGLLFPSTLPYQQTEEAAKLTIGEFACNGTASFLFELMVDGEVDFEQTAVAGIFVEHDCPASY